MGGLILPPAYRDDAASHPPLDYAGYGSTALRHPTQPLVALPQTLTELTGPLLGEGRVRPSDADLTRQHAGEPIGERIIVGGRVLEQRRPAGARHAGRGLAVQQRRALPARGRPAPGPARPELHRARAAA